MVKYRLEICWLTYWDVIFLAVLGLCGDIRTWYLWVVFGSWDDILTGKVILYSISQSSFLTWSFHYVSMEFSDSQPNPISLHPSIKSITPTRRPNVIQCSHRSDINKLFLWRCPWKLFLWRCPWCNCYRRRKWTRWLEFKSWTRLIAFSDSTNTLGKGMNPIILPPAMGK